MDGSRTEIIGSRFCSRSFLGNILCLEGNVEFSAGQRSSNSFLSFDIGNKFHEKYISFSFLASTKVRPSSHFPFHSEVHVQPPNHSAVSIASSFTIAGAAGRRLLAFHSSIRRLSSTSVGEDRGQPFSNRPFCHDGAFIQPTWNNVLELQRLSVERIVRVRKQVGANGGPVHDAFRGR